MSTWFWAKFLNWWSRYLKTRSKDSLFVPRICTISGHKWVPWSNQSKIITTMHPIATHTIHLRHHYLCRWIELCSNICILDGGFMMEKLGKRHHTLLFHTPILGFVCDRAMHETPKTRNDNNMPAFVGCVPFFFLSEEIFWFAWSKRIFSTKPRNVLRPCMIFFRACWFYFLARRRPAIIDLSSIIRQVAWFITLREAFSSPMNRVVFYDANTGFGLLAGWTNWHFHTVEFHRFRLVRFVLILYWTKFGSGNNNFNTPSSPKYSNKLMCCFEDPLCGLYDTPVPRTLRYSCCGCGQLNADKNERETFVLEILSPHTFCTGPP